MNILRKKPNNQPTKIARKNWPTIEMRLELIVSMLHVGHQRAI